MNNDEKILGILEQLIIGQENICSEIMGLKTDVEGLKVGQEKLSAEIVGIKTEIVGIKTEIVGIKTEIAWIKTDIEGLKVGQEKLSDEIVGLKTEINELRIQQKSDSESLASMIADTHEAIDKTNNRLDKKLDYLAKQIGAIKHVTTRNVYEIAELQQQAEAS
jgi:chromosome segregation ATPase